jgi:arsenite-transporting ATPase
MSLRDSIPPRRIVFFAGKGGVGKSTCAAAYALAVSEERDVLLLGADPAGSLADVLGVPVGAEPTRVSPGLTVVELDADARLGAFRQRYRQDVRAMFERLGLDRAAALDRRVLETIVGLAPPGIVEVFALDAILDGLAGDGILVVDTAPTGHFLRLLGMPDVALSWTRAALAVLLEYRSVIPLEGLATDLLAFSRRIEGLIGHLRDPDFACTVVVTLDEALPRRETERLLRELTRAGMGVEAVVRNFADDGVHPTLDGAGTVKVLAAPRTDFEGDDRPLGGAVDVGADEAE